MRTLEEIGVNKVRVDISSDSLGCPTFFVGWERLKEILINAGALKKGERVGGITLTPHDFEVRVAD